MGRLVMSTEERLLRSLIGVAPRRAAEAHLVPGWFAQSSPDVLRTTFARDRLVPLAGGRLRDTLGEAAPDWLHAWVDGHTAAARAHGERHELLELLVFGTLRQAGIAALPLKGTRVARDIHGDLALRSAGDIDVLVSARQLRAAADALVAAGWSPPGDPVDRDGLPLLHFVLRHPDGLPAVELHWRIHYHEREWASGVLARAAAAPGGEPEPPPGEWLALLLLMHIRDGANNLRLAGDIAGWWDRFGDGPMHDALAAVRTTPALLPAFVTAAVAADRGVGLPAERVLGLTTESPGCSRLEVRFATVPLAVTESQRDAERRLADHLVAPRSQALPAVRRQVLPNPAMSRYLRPHVADRPARLAADVALTTAMVPVRAAIAGLRLRGSAVATPLERFVEGMRDDVR
ncbi:MAG: nucleotidyltransferase family protein [Solirubrobacteraceae bacterium]|nr:nucleotidyltransferase family protein [Solirubrobacteraceae bacterium]